MKKIIIATGLLAGLFACDDTSTESSLVTESKEIANNEHLKADSLKSVEESQVEAKNAINLWKKLGMYTNPVKPNKWIKSVDFGRDMTIIKDTVVKNKTYYYVKIIEGDKGWVNGYCVAEDAAVAVATKKTTIYSAPDPLTITDKSLELGDFVVVYKEKIGDYWKFETTEKKLSGYLKSDKGISTEGNDLAASQVFKKIMSKEDPDEKLDALSDFLEDESYSTTSFAIEAQKVITLDSLQEIEAANSAIENMMEGEVEGGGIENAEEAMENVEEAMEEVDF